MEDNKRTCIFLLILILIHISASTDDCEVTVKSTTETAKCKFPFKFAGESTFYNGCTTDYDSNDQYWCSTDNSGPPDYEHKTGQWGYCDMSKCPKNTLGNRNESLYSNNQFNIDDTTIHLDILNGTVEEICGIVDYSLKNSFVAANNLGSRFNPETSWPWMVSIGYTDENDQWFHECGAILLTRQHVLTAAHCTLKPRRRLRFSDVDVKDDSDNLGAVIERDMASIVRHPKYKIKRAYYDVAVITIDGGPINFHDYALPVCLPSKPIDDIDHYNGDLVTLTGYGQISRDNKTSAGLLRRTSVTVFSQTYCNSTHSGRSGVDGRNIVRTLPDLFQDHMMCAGLEVGGPGSCKGDSGGPIVKFIDVEDRYVLVGIVEGGIGKCGNSDYPAIYIRVGDREILSFIQNATGLRTGIAEQPNSPPAAPNNDPCQSAKCGANEECISSGNLFRCRCKNGFVKDNVNLSCLPANPCNPNPCGANAGCTPQNNFAQCYCPSGYKGDPFKQCTIDQITSITTTTTTTTSTTSATTVRKQNCSWGIWRSWSPCSVSCGSGGVRTRSRSIARRAANGGRTCRSRDSSQIVSCPETIRSCPAPPKKNNLNYLLVTTGFNTNNTEIISWNGQRDNCRPVQDFPLELSLATGGVLLGDNGEEFPVICGGLNVDEKIRQKSCHMLKKATRQWTQIRSQMSEGRSSAASIVIDNGKTLWITGGNGGSSIYYKSTEVLTLLDDDPSFSVKPGPDLPLALGSHCLVKLNSSTAMLIGGHDGRDSKNNNYNSKSSTYFLDIPTSGQSGASVWRRGPDLNIARHAHSCGVLTNPGDGNHQVVVVAGGFRDSYVTLSSTEMWVVGSSQGWIKGPDMPQDTVVFIIYAAGIKTPDGKAFLFVGNNYAPKKIFRFEYSLDGWKWTKLDQELQVPRSGHVAMTVSDSFC